MKWQTANNGQVRQELRTSRKVEKIKQKTYNNNLSQRTKSKTDRINSKCKGKEKTLNSNKK